MNTKLQQTIHDLEQLPDSRREALESKFSEMVSRAKIDERLAASEARGGETQADEFFTALRAQYAG